MVVVVVVTVGVARGFLVAKSIFGGLSRRFQERKKQKRVEERKLDSSILKNRSKGHNTMIIAGTLSEQDKAGTIRLTRKRI